MAAVLRTLLTSPHAPTRLACAAALGRMPGAASRAGAVEPMLELGNAADANARAAGLLALGRLRRVVADGRVVPLLVQRIRHDPEWAVRRAAMDAAMRLGDVAVAEGALSAMQEAAENEADSFCRGTAASYVRGMASGMFAGADSAEGSEGASSVREDASRWESAEEDVDEPDFLEEDDPLAYGYLYDEEEDGFEGELF